MAATALVLSLFPGIGMLDRGFEDEGFCVVRGPDLLWGGDVRRFHPPAGVFAGVIGGPPCQAFSRLANLVRAKGQEPRHGNLIPEFERCVAEAEPEWWIMENVPGAPVPAVAGYCVQAQLLDHRWVPGSAGIGQEQRRQRRISFGTRDGRPLHVEIAALLAPAQIQAVTGASRPVPVRLGGSGKPKRSLAVTSGPGFVPERQFRARRDTPAVTAAHEGERNSGRIVRYSLADACRLQGLPDGFLKHVPFTAQAKLQVVANGVPLPMGRAIARAVRRAMGLTGGEDRGVD